MQIGVLVLGQPSQVLTVTSYHEEIAETTIIASEDQLLTIWTPRRRGHSAELQLDPLDLFIAVDIDDDDIVPWSPFGREGQVLPVRGPVRLRVDEAVRLVVAAHPRLEDTALHLSGDAVCQVQVDEVEVLLAEVRDPRPVR